MAFSQEELGQLGRVIDERLDIRLGEITTRMEAGFAHVNNRIDSLIAMFDEDIRTLYSENEYAKKRMNRLERRVSTLEK